MCEFMAYQRLNIGAIISERNLGSNFLIKIWSKFSVQHDDNLQPHVSHKLTISPSSLYQLQ